MGSPRETINTDRQEVGHASAMLTRKPVNIILWADAVDAGLQRRVDHLKAGGEGVGVGVNFTQIHTSKLIV
jgi:hypothetical protein